MQYLRSERVQSLIQEELGKLILREVEVPNALLTITAVEVSKKLDRALVQVSVLPSDKADEAMALLEKKAGYLQHLLLKTINIKPMPYLIFRFDHGPERAANIEKILLDEDNGEVPLK